MFLYHLGSNIFEMPESINEYLKQNPWMGGVVSGLMVVISGLLWTIIMSPRPITEILVDRGVWFTMIIIAVPLALIYVGVARHSH